MSLMEVMGSGLGGAEGVGRMLVSFTIVVLASLTLDDVNISPNKCLWLPCMM